MITITVVDEVTGETRTMKADAAIVISLVDDEGAEDFAVEVTSCDTLDEKTTCAVIKNLYDNFPHEAHSPPPLH